MDWKTVELGDLIHVKHGYAFEGDYFAEEGPYIVLTPGNFYEEGGFKSKGEDEKYYTGEVPEEYILSAGDLIVAMTEQAHGLLGSAAFVPEDDLYLHNQRLGLVQIEKQDELDQRFLYYLFNSYLVRSQISATASGAKVRHTSPSRIYETEVELPPLSVQRRIADILGAYDDLIANNRRRIELLEEMATAIFREWFVHYRFPGHADVETRETEIGAVPSEWEVKNLEEICDLTLGNSPKSKYYNEKGEGLPFHQGVRDFGDRFPEHTRHCSKLKRVAEEGDILFSVRAPVGRINIADCRMVIGRGLHAIRSTTGHQWFIFHQLRAKFFEEDLMGSGTIFKSVTKKDMLNLNLLVPPEELRDQFEETVRPIEDLIGNLTFKNRHLRETRDLLLPRLVSGEVEVGNAPNPKETIA